MLELLFLIIGLCFGSFSSVLIARKPTGRSKCPQCQQKLGVLELIPVISFLLQCGKCKSCNKAIGWTYPTLELGSALLFVYALTTAPTVFAAVLLALALWLLLVITVVDIQTHTISDAHSVPLLIVALAFNKSMGIFDITGAALGAAFFFGLWLLSRGKWIGSGDTLLAAGIGALLGSWQMMTACLMLTYIVGAAIVCVLLLMHTVKRGDYVAFAPFLALGTLLTIVFQERINIIIEFYL